MELRDLIEATDIVAYISQFVELEQRGDEFWGLSPFKDENTPSFSVRPSPPCFYDYSSGIAGNVFTFIRYYFHCSAAEAVQKLKDFTHFSGELSPQNSKLDATQSFRRFRPPEKHLKESKNTVLPDDVMLRYEKRQDKLDVWRREGISDAALEHFQVYYDAFADRLVYPIRNPDGKIVNIGGRTLDPAWKDKKLRKYNYYYAWGTINTLYGLYENLDTIRDLREIIIFEGAKSVLLAYTWGIRNAAAILTSHLSQNQMKLLAKLGVRAVFALDRDVDVSADRNIRKLNQYCTVQVIADRDGLLNEKDSPVDRGEAVFRQLYENRRPYR